MLAIDIEDEGLCVDFRGNEKGVAREMYRHIPDRLTPSATIQFQSMTTLPVRKELA